MNGASIMNSAKNAYVVDRVKSKTRNARGAKKLRNLFGFAAAFALALAILPSAAFAATEYDLCVNGERFTSDKLSIECGEGTATYDPVTKTLTLDNATITKKNAVYGYGIRAMGSDSLTIVLQGKNEVTLPDTSGVVSNASLRIQGEGSLAIVVGGDAQDGIIVGGDLTIAGARVSAKAPGGIGISCVGTVALDEGAYLESEGLYAGIDASGFSVQNKSVAHLSSKDENCNAAYIRKKGTDGTGGNISLSNSEITATSFYPGLFASGDILIDGGSVHSVSTNDSALWASGNMTFQGGAKLVLEGMYPTGCDGVFAVYAAEVDAKNKNTENFPAIADNPIINDGFELTYALAVDSENTEIDLIKHDGTDKAKDYLNLYKNIHFIVSEQSSTQSFPFSKIVKKGGDVAPGKQAFELEIFCVAKETGVTSSVASRYADVVVTAVVETNGEGAYAGNLVLEGPKSQVKSLTSEGFYVREKNTGAANWTYSDAVYRIACYDIEILSTQSVVRTVCEILPVQLVTTDNGSFYQPTQDVSVDTMTFENEYTEKAAPGGEEEKPTPGGNELPDEGDKPDDTGSTDNPDTPSDDIPRTGDASLLVVGVVSVLAVACLFGIIVLRKRARRRTK